MSVGTLAQRRVEPSSTVDEIRMAATALAIALLGLNVLDILVTELAIDRFGGIEVNPLMAPIVGTTTGFGLKVLIPLVILALATRARTWHSVTTLRVVVAVYLLVAIIGVGQVAYVLV